MILRKSTISRLHGPIWFRIWIAVSSCGARNSSPTMLMSPVRSASTRLSSRTDTKGAFALVLLLGVSACYAAPRPTVVPASLVPAGTAQLQRDIQTILAAPALTRSYWGILVSSAKNNDTLYSLNAQKLLMPGSTMKIVTLAAAAERLGWDYIYDTRLVATGSI